MKEHWKSEPKYAKHVVNGSLCSILKYLSEVCHRFGNDPPFLSSFMKNLCSGLLGLFSINYACMVYLAGNHPKLIFFLALLWTSTL